MKYILSVASRIHELEGAIEFRSRSMADFLRHFEAHFHIVVAFEQFGHDVIRKLIQVLSHRVQATSPEVGVDRWRHNLGYFDGCVFELLAQTEGEGMHGRLGGAVGRHEGDRTECQPRGNVGNERRGMAA